MALALFNVASDPAIRRFIVWMAIGAAFILTLVTAEDYIGISIP
jgi:hypothetical protein